MSIYSLTFIKYRMLCEHMNMHSWLTAPAVVASGAGKASMPLVLERVTRKDDNFDNVHSYAAAVIGEHGENIPPLDYRTMTGPSAPKDSESPIGAGCRQSFAFSLLGRPPAAAEFDEGGFG